jgi:hypothetical protein
MTRLIHNLCGGVVAGDDDPGGLRRRQAHRGTANPEGEALIVLGSQSGDKIASCVLELKRDPRGKHTAPGREEGKAEAPKA